MHACDPILNVGCTRLSYTDICLRLEYLKRAIDDGDPLDEEREECAALCDLRIDIERIYGRGNYDVTLILDSDFEEYAVELAEDMHSAGSSEWPFAHVDWTAAADALKDDYVRMTLGSDTYWIHR